MENGTLQERYGGLCQGETDLHWHVWEGRVKQLHRLGAIWGRQFKTRKQILWAHRDLVMLPIEIVSPRDPFLFRGRESYNIWKFQTEGFWILNMDSTWMRVNVEPLLLICGQKMCDSDSVKTNIIWANDYLFMSFIADLRMEVNVDLRNISSQPQQWLFRCSLVGWPGWGLGLELKPFCYFEYTTKDSYHLRSPLPV